MCSCTTSIRYVLAVVLVANVLGAQPACKDAAQASVWGPMTSIDSSDAISLLQVNSVKAASSNDIDHDQTADKDQAAKQDHLHDLQSAAMLMDVNFGVLREKSLLMLNKSYSPALLRFGNDASNWVDIPADSADHFDMVVAPLTWIFGSYHKTGCQLILGMCWVLGGNAANNIEDELHQGQGGPLFNNEAWSNWFFEPNLDIITKVHNYRFVHMIRYPAAAIVSAYRYHCHISEDTEHFLDEPMNDPEEWCMYRGDCKLTFTRYGILPKLKADENMFHSIVEQDHQDIMKGFFKAVDAGKTLPEYYASVPPTQGIVVEIYRSFSTLNMMSDNYGRTRNDDKTVQVRMGTSKMILKPR